MVAKKRKVMFRKKRQYLILYPPPPSQNIYLRQPKNNENQINTTRGQNLKEFSNTAGRLVGSL